MPVFVSTTFAQNQSSVLDVIGTLIKYNIYNIELGSIHRYKADLHYKLLETNCKYITHNFFPPTSDRFILNIASTDESILRRSLMFIKQAIDFAELIGAEIYTIHPGFLIDPAGESRSSKIYDFEFPYNSSAITTSNYLRCFEIFLNSLNEISSYIRNKPITVAVETQGSVSKKFFMLFSKPKDFSIFFKEIQNINIGINLNLGHLNLAANAWGFDKYKLVEMIKPLIVAVEVSHNDGAEDSHQALKSDGWYMNLLKDDFFRNIPVIFEGRCLDIHEVVQSYQQLRDILE